MGLFEELLTGGFYGYFDQGKMKTLVKKRYYLRLYLMSVVALFIQRCLGYQVAKGGIQNTSSYLFLLIPNTRWEHFSMGFVLNLPRQHGFHYIFVETDRFLKKAHIISCKNSIDASYVTALFSK